MADTATSSKPSGSTANTKTQSRASGAPAHAELGPQVYFEPSTGYLVFVEKKEDILQLRQEADLLDHVIEQLHKATQEMADAQAQNLKISQANLPHPDDVKTSEAAYLEAQKKLKAAQNELRQKVVSTLDPLKTDSQQESTQKKDTPAAPATPPKMEPVEKTDPTKITELLPLWKPNASNEKATGYEMVFVRSNKINPAWRRYQIGDVNLKTGEASFIKDGKIDKEELTKQLKKIELKLKIDLFKIDDKSGQIPARYLLNPHLGIIGVLLSPLSNWIDNWNHTLKMDTLKAFDGQVCFDASAQFLRWMYGASGGVDIDPTKGAKIKVEAHGELALAEGKATLAFIYPDERGWMLSLPLAKTGTNTDLGRVRFYRALNLSGVVGASIAVESGVEADWSGGLQGKYGVKGIPAQNDLPAPTTGRRFNLKMPDADLKFVELNAFAGAQATAALTADLQWLNPETGQQYDSIAKCEPGITGQAGAGVTGALSVSFINGKFCFLAKMGLCWGLGAKGSVVIEVTGNTIANFVMWAAHQARNVDYVQLQELYDKETDAFYALAGLMFMSIQAGRDIYKGGKIAYSTYIEIAADIADEDDRVRLMNSVLDNPDSALLKFSAPETKGMILARLIDKNWVEPVDPRNQGNDPFKLSDWKIGSMKRRKRAVMMVFKWVQSQADYRNVLQHMNMLPDDPKQPNWQANEKKLMAFLGLGEFTSWGHLGGLSTDFGGNLRSLYLALGQRAPVQPNTKFFPNDMAPYLAQLDKQGHDDVMTA